MSLHKLSVRFLWAIILMGGILLSSCSVKEDRSDCPSFIVVNLRLQGAYEPGTAITCYIFDKNGVMVASGTYPAEAYSGDAIYFPVKRNQDYTVSCVTGVDAMSIEDNRLILSPDGVSDAIFGFSESVHVGMSDYGYDVTGRLCKEYADVKLTVVDPQEDYPFRFELRSGTSGLSLLGFHPLEGFNCHAPDDMGDGHYRTRICRQSDISELMLDIYLNSDTKASEEPRYTLPLGSDLLKAGYDPYAEDMEDIDMEVTYAEASLCIRIGDWEVVYDGNFEI